MTPLKVLLVEDRAVDAELVLYELTSAGFEVDWQRVETAEEYLAHLDADLDLILADYHLPSFSGIEALRLVKERGLHIPFILVSGTIGEELAVEAMRAGASDYLLKDRLARLGDAVKRTLHERQLQLEMIEAETALRRSEERFRRLAENAQDIIFRWRVEPPGLEYISPSVTTITGYQPEEFYADPGLLRRITHPDDQQTMLDMVEGKRPFQAVAVRMIARDGHTVWLERRSHPVYDEQGTLIATEGIVRDMTERLQIEQEKEDAQQQLEVEHKRLETLYRVGQMLNSTLDLGTILNALTDEAMRVTNAAHGQVVVVSKDSTEFEHHSLRGFSDKDTARLMTERLPLDEGLNGIAYQTQGVVRVDDVAFEPNYIPGVATTRSEIVIPIIRDGKVLGNLDLQSPAVAAFADADVAYLSALAAQAAIAILNARLFQELEDYSQFLEQAVEQRTGELQRAKERTEAILDHSTDPILLLNAQGGIESGNPAFSAMFGHHIDQVHNRPPMYLVERGYSERVRVALDATLHQAEHQRLDVVAQRADQSTFDIDMALAPIRVDEQVIGAVCMLRDISRQKEVDRMKDAFVANVSHELRTPITGIKLNHAMIERDPGRQDVYMARLGREISRLNELIEDLLRLSRLEQGRVELNMTTVDLNSVGTQLVADRAPMAETRGLMLLFEEQPGMPPVRADAGLLGQALSVLITNAINYTPDGGRIVVAAIAHTELDRRWSGFSVSDTGPGIALEEQPRLFERFYRGTVGRASGAPGTGLGLAIAREIVERHQGRLELHSEGVPGKGARFNIWLPAVD
jgi:PAS domain S-box-containing protein